MDSTHIDLTFENEVDFTEPTTNQEAVDASAEPQVPEGAPDVTANASTEDDNLTQETPKENKPEDVPQVEINQDLDFEEASQEAFQAETTFREEEVGQDEFSQTQEPPSGQEDQTVDNQNQSQGLDQSQYDGSNQVESQQENNPAEASSAPGDESKLFVGGLDWETTEEHLREHFSKYGELFDLVIMKDPFTKRTRGFGFVQFTDQSIADKVLAEDHHIGGRKVDVKRAVPKGSQEPKFKSTKIFVGNLPTETSEDQIRSAFEQFGSIVSINVMMDKATGAPRGFGFIQFEDTNASDAALAGQDIQISGKILDVKAAQPRNPSFPPRHSPYGHNTRPSGGPARFRPNYGSSQGPGGQGRYNNHNSNGSHQPGYRSYGNSGGSSRYGMGATHRANSGYDNYGGYGGYNYGGYNHNSSGPPSSYGRYNSHPQRPSSGGYNSSQSHGYGSYGGGYQQQSHTSNYGTESNSYGQSGGYGARPRYSSRPQQSRPYNPHPYAR